MAARSIASLTVSFGLVAIPVKLYSATVSAGRIHFHMLHARDGSRLKQQYVCQKEGVVVPREEIVKGYEFARDQYVMFSAAEIKALEEAGSHSIDIAEFLPVSAIDPVWFDTTYYLAPDKGGAKPYTLLNRALRERGRCALGHWASRGRDHVVLLRPLDSALVLHQLHFASEVRPVTEIDIPETAVRDQELKLAAQLIDSQSSDHFDPSAFRDEVGERIQAAIDRKVQGEEITLSEPAPAAGAQVIDLMAALRASLERGGRDRKPPAAAPAAQDEGAATPRSRSGSRRGPQKAGAPRRAPRGGASGSGSGH